MFNRSYVITFHSIILSVQCNASFVQHVGDGVSKLSHGWSSALLHVVLCTIGKKVKGVLY